MTQDDCERIITSLLLEKVVSTNPKWNAYDTVIYLVLGELGPNMLSSTNPKFVVRLPLREDTKVAASKVTKAAKQSTLRQTLAKDGEWLSTKPTSVKRKKAATAKTKPKAKTIKPAKKIKGNSTKKAVSKVTTAGKTKAAKLQTAGKTTEIIELSSDDDDDGTEPDVPLVSLRQVDERDVDEVLWDDDDDNGNDSDEEYEFEE